MCWASVELGLSWSEKYYVSDERWNWKLESDPKGDYVEAGVDVSGEATYSSLFE